MRGTFFHKSTFQGASEGFCLKIARKTFYRNPCASATTTFMLLAGGPASLFEQCLGSLSGIILVCLASLPPSAAQHASNLTSSLATSFRAPHCTGLANAVCSHIHAAPCAKASCNTELPPQSPAKVQPQNSWADEKKCADHP